MSLSGKERQAVILLACGLSAANTAAACGVEPGQVFAMRKRREFVDALEDEIWAGTVLMRLELHAAMMARIDKAMLAIDNSLAIGGAEALAAAKIVLARLPVMDCKQPRPVDETGKSVPNPMMALPADIISQMAREEVRRMRGGGVQ